MWLLLIEGVGEAVDVTVTEVVKGDMDKVEVVEVEASEGLEVPVRSEGVGDVLMESVSVGTKLYVVVIDVDRVGEVEVVPVVLCVYVP